MSKIDVNIVENDLLDHYFPDNDDSDSNNKKGRPKKGEELNKPKWQPKKWKPEYEKIVMMDLAGLKGYEIAEKLDCTPQHIYNILSTDEAIAIQRALVHKIRKESVNITDEIEKIQKLTVKRLKDSLENDNIFKESRLGFINQGINVMKGVGEYLKNKPENEVNNNTFILPESVADRFVAGLEKSDEAQKLLKSKNSSREIEEAEFEVVDSSE